MKQNYYENPVTGELWTEKQWLEYVAFEEQKSSERYNCENCYGCQNCEG